MKVWVVYDAAGESAVAVFSSYEAAMHAIEVLDAAYEKRWSGSGPVEHEWDEFELDKQSEVES